MQIVEPSHDSVPPHAVLQVPRAHGGDLGHLV